MNHKMIAIDLDGTLLDDKKKVPEENKAVIKELSARGVEIVIATGRRYYSAKEFVSTLDMTPIVMANNGSIVRDMKDDSLLVTRYFDDDDFYSVIGEGKDRGLDAITHVDYFSEGYDIIIEREKNDKRYSNYLRDIANRYRTIDDMLKHSDPRALAVIYTGELERLKEFYNNLNFQYKGKYNAYMMYNLKDVGAMLEIIHSKTSKWLSILDYANQKGIDKSEIVAIGDDNNDMEMIKNAGFGIAMKNATKEVKSVSDMITTRTNDESGLGHALKEVFKL